MIPHPKDFYIAHRVYTLRTGPAWGALTDGPDDKTEMTDRIADSFHDEPPTLKTLRVWHFTEDCPARDVTEDFILDWIET
jgi:hypothetical protein